MTTKNKKQTYQLAETKIRASQQSQKLKQYLKKINETPLLTFEEEKQLWKKTREGDTNAKERIIRANLKLVVSVAKKYREKYRNHNLTLMELIQEGTQGLVKAVEKFDYRKGYRFSEYAIWWIRSAITRYMALKRRETEIKKEFIKRCSCGRPYFYLESLKKCPVCKRKLIFYGDLVNVVIHGYYIGCPYSTCGRTLIEKIIFLGEGARKRDSKDPEKLIFKEPEEIFEWAREIFYKDEEKKYFKDILVFLRLFLKEIEEKYKIIKEKEKNNELSEKDPFENLIIKRIKYNYWFDAHYGFLNSFPVKSISKEQILKDLGGSSCSKREKDVVMYSLNHQIEETGKKTGVTRERIKQINTKWFLELYQNTKEYKDYKKSEEKLKKAEVKYAEAVKRYYKSTEEKAKKIN